MSIRLFNRHSIRTHQPLDGTWTFLFPEDGTALSPDATPGDGTRALLLATPSVWESTPEWVDYKGQAVAIRRIELAETGPLRLVFEGVSHTCRVFLDGAEIGRHHNAFTGFTIELPEVTAGEHELRLWISNEHGELSALHFSNDYYNYGGISRPAEVQFPRKAVIVERIHVTPTHSDGSWQARAEVTLNNFSDQPFENLQLKVQLAGEARTCSLAEVPTGESTHRFEFTCDDVRCWAPDQPTLYSVAATLSDADGTAFDDLWDRFGFRTVAVEGQNILLNGSPLQLIGVNRHEDHPDFGCAIPVEMMQRDLAIIRELGCNMVRTSHYPNDRRFLDLCDERGILVWEESHARGICDGNSNHPLYVEQTRDNTREMVLARYNHPAIFIWGYLNECDAWTEAGREAYQVAEATIKAVDTSRPTTYAACHDGKDKCQSVPDVISWNRYPLWYGASSVNEDLDKVAELMEKNGVADKPLILSEFGGGAFPGYRDHFRKAKWSEDYQAEILDRILTDLLANQRVIGAIVWQYCDVRVDAEWAFARPRTMNNKGIVDEYRRPKLAFSVVRKHFLEKSKELKYGKL